MKLKVLLLVFFAASLNAVAQPGWNWPEDESLKSQAEEKNVLYNDALKMKNYADAATNLEWLLENTPDLNPALYINGVKIYKGLLAAETDEARKSEIEERIMTLYDSRIQYFNSEADVIQRKAFDAYRFYKDDKAKYQELYELYEKAYELNGNNIGNQHLVAYMDVIRRYKLTGGEISDVEVLDKYTTVTEIMDYKVANGESEVKIAKLRDTVDKLLTATVTVDCDFIQNSLAPKIKDNPEDVKMAKKIIALSINAGCTDSDAFLAAAEIVQANEPNAGTAKIIASKYASAKDYTNAEKYYKEALELAETTEKKADIYYELGLMYAQSGRKSSARSNLYECLKLDPGRKRAYKIIGDMYMTSYNECKKDESKVEDRAIFIAAYEMYKKAGDANAMNNAKAQFPSVEELFTETFKEGDTYTVGCWINETVILQTRPSS